MVTWSCEKGAEIRRMESDKVARQTERLRLWNTRSPTPTPRRRRRRH